MMAILKAHWISLLCGVLTIGFVVFGTVTLSSDTVKAEMKQQVSKTGADNIRNLITTPVSAASIENKRLEGKRFDEEYDKTIKAAQSINKRDPLMPGVFPKPEDPAVTPLRFRDAYVQTFLSLAQTPALAGGAAPNNSDIADAQADIDEMLRRESEEKEETKMSDKTGTGATPGQPMPPPPPVDIRGRGNPRSINPLAPGGPPMGGEGGGARSPGMSLTAAQQNDPKYNPVYRARIAKAKGIRCYVDNDSFQLSPIALSQTPPSAADMWYAQVGLWIQRDIVDAVASLNKEAADKVTEGDASVENSPVKRIVGLQVHGYVLGNKDLLRFVRIAPSSLNPQASAAGATATPVDLSPSRSFSARTGNDQYDVVRVTLVVIADQRDLNLLVDRVCKQNFYLCTHMRYEALDREQQEQAGYVYGTDPVVQATLDFEVYLARDVYEKMWPDAVRAQLTGQGGQQP